MTDTELVHRAEQAYLGALLARHGQAGSGNAVAGDGGPDALGALRPQDFADPVHQAIYAAIASQARPARRGPAGLYDRMRAALALLLSPRARAAAGYMGALPGMCPDPANVAAYATMVTEASQARAAQAPAGRGSAPPPAPRREPAPEGSRLDSAARWLDGSRATGRRRAAAWQADPSYAVPPSKTGGVPPGLDRQTARLARLLAGEVRRLKDLPQPAAYELEAPEEAQAASFTVGGLQAQLLAHLMLHPFSAGDVFRWLPASAFTDGDNRVLYQLISRRLHDGRPVDPLIIAWDASMFPGTADPPGQRGSLVAAALRISAMSLAPGTATSLAEQLFARQESAEPSAAYEPAGASRTGPPPVAAPARQDPAAGPRRGHSAGPVGRRAPARRASDAPQRTAWGTPVPQPPLPGPAEPAWRGPDPRTGTRPGPEPRW